MAAVKRNDPKKRPVPAVEKLGKRPGTSAAPPRAKARPARADGRRGRDGGRKPAQTNDADAPVFIGGPKNEFGTRVARRITCSRCGAVDHVPHAPRKLERALCRACAVEVLKTYEVGTRMPVQTRPAVCSLCKKPFALPVKVELTDEILCPDCLRGFATWTGGIDTTWDQRQDVVIEARVSGTLVRRRKK
ncbi:MAG: hypothetical protein IT383_25640 [Deltaproteobacteria bacterium]|nr:hypothetical protein [Deltaproteobacteria bacterium]